jgi:hypothetical protein
MVEDMAEGLDRASGDPCANGWSASSPKDEIVIRAQEISNFRAAKVARAWNLSRAFKRW